MPGLRLRAFMRDLADCAATGGFELPFYLGDGSRARRPAESVSGAMRGLRIDF
jgi:hypothetical protein